jgi:HEAT repeat protein
LADLSAKEAVRLDEGIRRRLAIYSGTWPEDVLSDDMPADVLAALRASHPNGRIREAAVMSLSGVTTGFELPFLLLRVNDWVAPVRAAALEAVKSRLHVGYADHLVRNIELFAWLEGVLRTDNRAWVRGVRKLLTTAPFRPSLEAGLNSSDRFVRRGAFKLLLMAPDVSLPDLARRGLRSHDTVLCLLAARTVATQPDREEFHELLLEMRSARFTPIRRAAFEALIAGKDAALYVEEALADPHPAVRLLGQAHAREASIDLGSWYAARLAASQTRRLAAVIAGLGESGDRERAHLVIEYISHALPSVRLAALSALFALGHESTAAAAFQALSDESGSVSRRALQILRRRVAEVDPARVWGVVTGNARFHAKRNALVLLPSLGKWPSAAYLIRAAGSADPALGKTGLQLLRGWIQRFNASFVGPSQEQLDSLRAAVAECGSSLPKALAEQLRFLADSAA